MPHDHDGLMNEIRYAERLCLRTARLYRRLQACATFMTVVGGSAAVAPLALNAGPTVSAAGAAAFAVFGALLLAVRPADKVAANEADAKRYAKLKTDGRVMTFDQLAAALDKARESDTQEVEPLRDVAWNDVVYETGNPHAAVALRPTQRLLAALA